MGPGGQGKVGNSITQDNARLWAARTNLVANTGRFPKSLGLVQARLDKRSRIWPLLQFKPGFGDGAGGFSAEVGVGLHSRKRKGRNMSRSWEM